MSFSGEKVDALRLLDGIEEGGSSSNDLFNLGHELDPLLVFFVFRYVREKYPPSSPSSQGVVERLLELSTNYADLVAKAKKGEEDPLVEWFDDAFELRDYFSNPERLIEMLCEKMDS